ncbi:PAS domain S-box protein [Chelatococcus sambhunathii]|uniref:Blue-light-activated histidine kinase n=1 Tax=Chelatococcus sambhunathii TaxID=363953 RepID=A0ABU1DI34_9HYPH|nr:PAS domain S-box protein [Chelatococcus sambhunathii]MDR4307690.1 PAS domain S-box protein [Chelatococcus sambhunathii]
MPSYEQMVRRQRLLGRFGAFALQSEDLDQVLEEACRLVAEALGVERAKILEIQGDDLLVRAGVGWGPDVVGVVRLSMRDHSSESFSIAERRPVFARDIREDDRFDVPAFMKEAGVVALVNVPIFLPGDRAFGLLQVASMEPREFGDEDAECLRTYSTLLGPVIDRLQKVASLRETREVFKLIVENARDYAIFVTDPDGLITHWFRGAEAVFGWSEEEARGLPASVMFTPEDLAAGDDVKELETARTQGSAPDVRWHVRKGGSRAFIHGSTIALRGTSGELQGFFKIGQDVTGRHEGERALERGRARLQALVEGIPQLVWRASDDGEWLWSSRQWSAFTGLSEGDSEGLGWIEAVHPEDRAQVRAAWRGTGARSSLEMECRIRRAGDGSYRWFAMRASPVAAVSGETSREWLGTFTDIHDLRRLQDVQQVLVRELQHRTRNLLGVVSSVAAQTAATASSVPNFEARFNSRISALSRAQGLLSTSEDTPVSLGRLVDLELRALGPDILHGRVEVGGPETPLPAAAVQTLALALHELATNARKHGALASDEGTLSVKWAVEEGDAPAPHRIVRIEWLERGPERIPGSKPERRGYGRELIEDALPYALDARTKFELEAHGLRCLIELPLEDPPRAGT